MTAAEARIFGAAWIQHGGGWRLGAVDLHGRVFTGVETEMAFPDPRQPATLGTWLATIREIKAQPRLAIVPDFTGGWNICVGGGFEQERGILATFPSEAVALLALLGVPPNALRALEKPK